MREFEHPNMDNFKCPICGMSTDAPVVLIPIPETEEGHIIQAEQVHSACVEYSISMYLKVKRDYLEDNEEEQLYREFVAHLESIGQVTRQP